MKNEKDSIINFQKKFMEMILPKEFPENLKNDMNEYIYFRKELTSESDRGCALLAASHLDFLLEKLLSIKLIGTKKQKKQIFDFNGPLGTFSGRIIMAYSLGLISEIRLKDLQTIRKIRNDFGHSPLTISFENERIKSLSNNLKLIIDSNKTSRAKFITSVSFISGGLTALIDSEKPFEQNKEIDIDKVRKGALDAMELARTILENEKNE
jgi:hypothetical protein